MSEHYIYHAVPEEFRGTMLIPLNRLRDAHPDLYEKYTEKYQGREELFEVRLPMIGCRWNDVLHCSAVHPATLKQALIAAGRPKNFFFRFFKIDLALLNQENIIVFSGKILGGSYNRIAEECTRLDLSTIEQLAVLPEETKTYYAQTIAKNRKPMLHMGSPHILYKGEIDTTKHTIITV